MKPGLYHEQKCSQLLSKDENESVLQLLGPKCQVNYFLLFYFLYLIEFLL